jgi:hypothetical protein
MKNLSLGAKIGVISGIMGAAAGIGTAITTFFLFGRSSAPRETLSVRFDTRGPYLILATNKAEKSYAKAIVKAMEFHPQAARATFAPDDLAGARKVLQERQPRYALLFMEPAELDVNWAWQWLTLATQLDDDPFVDVRTGIITGATPDDAAAFVERIGAAVGGRAKLPGLCLDNLGPNTQAGKTAFYRNPGNFMIPVLERRLGLVTISHGVEAFTDERLASMNGAGIVHLGGHGHPDRVDEGLRGAQVKNLQLSPCVVFNGACYTGVTHRWYEQWTQEGKVAEKIVPAADCFCLNLLRNEAVAYLAALHPDHGVPVYQEMEHLAFSGAPLGDVIKYTHDGVILGSGGRLPKFERFASGMPSPQWTPSDVMLKGTASRVLFGDPALVVLDAFSSAPFSIAQKEKDGALHVTATLANPSLKSSYTDTYHADLARDKNLFNDRALIVADLPQGWNNVSGVEVVCVKAGGQAMQHRLVGYGVERDGEKRRLHAQVDVPSHGYMQSPFRVVGAEVELKVKR